eukprot:gene26654-biopygen3078
MPALPHLPEEVVADLVLRALRLEAPLCDMSVVCRIWHSTVVRHLAEVLISRYNANMVSVLGQALEHNKLDVALDLVTKTGSLEESEAALVLVAKSGQADLVRCLLHAPQHAAHADGQDGQALVAAAGHGHFEVVCMLLTARHHSAHANSQDGEALVLAAIMGHNCQDGEALVQAASNEHMEVVCMLLDAPDHAAHADSQNGEALVQAAMRGRIEVMLLELTAKMGRHLCKQQ